MWAILYRNSLEMLDELSQTVYGELRRLATAALRREDDNHTLQPTALVHEALLRLREQRDLDWSNRGLLLSVAVKTMRRVLIDHARSAEGKRRRWKVEVAEGLAAEDSPPAQLDVIDLERALGKLESIDERQCRIVEMRFFAGLTFEEIAKMLELSSRTVKRDWSFARAWLIREMKSR